MEAGRCVSLVLMLPHVSDVRYAVTLERGADGSYLAWVNKLPGCAVRGESRDDVLTRVPAAIRDFLRWAGVEGQVSPEVAVVAEGESMIEAEEDTEVLVPDDEAPLSRGDWTRVEALLNQSRDELLRLLATLSDDQLAAMREGSSRTVREEFEHVAFVELMYLMWTFDLRSRGGLSEFLGWTRSVTLERMGRLAEAASSQLTYADWAGAPRPEPWTPRKAARRLLWHELLHLRALERWRMLNSRQD